MMHNLKLQTHSPCETTNKIYNETIRDLLGDADDQKKHEIKKGHGDVYVTDI